MVCTLQAENLLFRDWRSRFATYSFHSRVVPACCEKLSTVRDGHVCWQEEGHTDNWRGASLKMALRLSLA